MLMANMVGEKEEFNPHVGQAHELVETKNKTKAHLSRFRILLMKISYLNSSADAPPAAGAAGAAGETGAAALADSGLVASGLVAAPEVDAV